MLSNQEKGPTMSRQLLVKECRSTKDKLIERVGFAPMDLMGPLMVMEYKQLVEVHIKPLMQLCNLLRRERYNGCILIHLSWYTVWF